MRFDLYVPGDSWLHHLDPRSKLLAVAVVMLAALLVKNLVVLAALLLLTHLLLLLARVPLERLRWIWARMAPLTLFILILQPLFAGGAGSPLFRLGPLVVTTGGILDGISFALRANAMAFAASILLFVTDQHDLVRGLVRLGLPYDYGLTFSLALRYLPTSFGLWMSVVDAQRARGWTPERQNLLARLRAYLPILVAVIIAAIRLSDDLGLALAARGFGAAQPRSVWHEIRFSTWDWLVSLLMTAFLAALIMARVIYGLGATPF